MVALVPINQLPAGTAGLVRDVTGLPEHIQRLEELGWRHGERIEVLRAGTPCIVRLSGGRYCLRETDAFHVFVAPEGNQAAS